MASDAVQQIKDKLNIVDVIGQYTELKPAGRHFKGKSPFSNERTPSFYVSPDRGMYYCFSTNQGGDIFKFIETIEGVDFKTALKMLAERAGVELVPERPEKRNERQILYDILEATANWYASQRAAYRPAEEYLERRGVTEATKTAWQIGYAPGPPNRGWRELRSYLATKNFSDAVMQKAGLIKPAPNGKEPFDVFRDRIMFPLRDPSGRVVGFSGRILTPNDQSPKYVNSPETDLYHKSDMLFGYDFAKSSVRKLNFWLIVEGQFDVVMAHQCGYQNAVAVSGTAFTTRHVELLERLSKNVVLAMDSDAAGIAAMKKAAKLLLARGLDVKVTRLEGGKDPADIIQVNPADFRKMVGSSIHVIEFLLEHLKAGGLDDRTFKLRVHDEILPFITLLPNRIDQEHFEGVVATAIGTTKEAVRYEVERQADKGKGERPSALTDTAPSIPLGTADRDSLTDRIAFLLSFERLFLKEPFLTAELSKFIEHFTETFPADAVLIEKASFQAELMYERWTPRAMANDVAHRLFLIRQEYVRDLVQRLRRGMADGDNEAAAAAKMAEVQKLLNQPLPTEEDIIPIIVKPT